MSTRSPGKHPEDPLRICECLEKKLDSLRNFYLATASVKKTVDCGEADRIDNLIHEREKCMDIIDRIDDYMQKTGSDKPAYFSSLPDKTKAMIKALGGRIEKTLKEISALDKECNTAAALRIGILQQELLKTMRDRHGFQGYGDNKHRIPRFLDMKL